MRSVVVGGEWFHSRTCASYSLTTLQCQRVSMKRTNIYTDNFIMVRFHTPDAAQTLAPCVSKAVPADANNEKTLRRSR